MIRSLESLRLKWSRFCAESNRPDLDPRARRLNLIERTLNATGLAPTIGVAHEHIYELTSPPKAFRGLRDLGVRRAGPDDVDELSALDRTSIERIRARFAHGDLVFVAEQVSDQGRRILAHTWFHRGPEPFDEDAPLFPRWTIAPDTFWSYHAYTLPEARNTGVFIKVFSYALNELWTGHGASRVRCMVKATNVASISLHEKMRFKRLGTVTVVAAAGLRWVTWRDEHGPKRWLQLRNTVSELLLPPA